MREAGRITNLPINPNVPVNTAWDLGWDDFTAIWFFQQIGQEVFIIDFYQCSHQDLPGITEDLRKKRYKYGYHLLPHDVEVTEGLSAGNKSRRQILNECGVRVTTVPRVKRKEDAHAAVQALLPRCYFSEARTVDGLDALSLYRREKDPRLDILRATPVHDWTSHAADAMMTLAMGIKGSAGTEPRTTLWRRCEMTLELVWDNPCINNGKGGHRPWLNRTDLGENEVLRSTFTCSSCGKKGVVEFKRGQHQHLSDVLGSITWDGDDDAPSA